MRGLRNELATGAMRPAEQAPLGVAVERLRHPCAQPPPASTPFAGPALRNADGRPVARYFAEWTG